MGWSHAVHHVYLQDHIPVRRHRTFFTGAQSDILIKAHGTASVPKPMSFLPSRLCLAEVLDTNVPNLPGPNSMSTVKRQQNLTHLLSAIASDRTTRLQTDRPVPVVAVIDVDRAFNKTFDTVLLWDEVSKSTNSF